MIYQKEPNTRSCPVARLIILIGEAMRLWAYPLMSRRYVYMVLVNRKDYHGEKFDGFGVAKSIQKHSKYIIHFAIKLLIIRDQISIQWHCKIENFAKKSMMTGS